MNEKEIIIAYIELQLSKQKIYSEMSDNSGFIKITSNTHCKKTAIDVIKELIDVENDLVVFDNKIDLTELGLPIDYVLLNKSQMIKNKVYNAVYVLVNDNFTLPTNICYNNLIQL